jgi:DNA-binding Lrp family transcriptional regulator
MDMKRSVTERTLTSFQRRLLGRIEDGLPLVATPYAWLAERLECSEAQVIAALAELLERGVIKRLGIVVRHHELGYRANAMVVWDIPDGRVGEVGRRLGRDPVVRLCYRRPRRLPEWRYNLFTMVHGRDRADVQAEIEGLARRHGLDSVPREVLFSRRRFKQRGACYIRPDDRSRTTPGSVPPPPILATT